MARGKLIGVSENHQLYTKQNSKWHYIATSEEASKIVANKDYQALVFRVRLKEKVKGVELWELYDKIPIQVPANDLETIGILECENYLQK